LATDLYIKLLKKAEDTKLKTTKKMQQEIKKAYEDVYIQLKKDIEKSVDGTLNQRWLEDYVKNLEKEIEVLNNNLETKLKKNIDKVVTAQTDSQLQFFNEISDRYGLGLKETFSSMFSTFSFFCLL
jgi:predicted transcriptional regulator